MGCQNLLNFLYQFQFKTLWYQMEEYAHRRNVILEIIKAHYNIMSTRPSNVNCGNINVIAMGPNRAWIVLRCHPREFMILFISSSVNVVGSVVINLLFIAEDIFVDVHFVNPGKCITFYWSMLHCISNFEHNVVHWNWYKKSASEGFSRVWNAYYYCLIRTSDKTHQNFAQASYL